MYRIAESIGCTVNELEDRLLAEELLGWVSYYELQREAEEKAAEDAKKKAKTGHDDDVPRGRGGGRTMGSQSAADPRRRRG